MGVLEDAVADVAGRPEAVRRHRHHLPRMRCEGFCGCEIKAGHYPVMHSLRHGAEEPFMI